MTPENHLIVVGGGIAGISAAQAARHEYPHARITVFSEEPHPFYNKIALNSVVTGKMQEEHLRVFTPRWLENQRIGVQIDRRVELIDGRNHAVHVSGGSIARYDKLILATGAISAVPPIAGIETSSVLQLWSLKDAIHIRERLGQSDTVAIIGGGVLGVEIAVDLGNLGKSVTLIESEPTLLPFHLDSKAALLYQQFMESRGIRLALGAHTTNIDSRDGKTCLLMADGRRIEADLVLLVVGVAPSISLARASGIETDRGIIVDSYLRTSDPDILACGNCIELAGKQSALWSSAMSQGEIAGLNAFQNKKPWIAHEPAIHVKTPQMPLFICGQFTDVVSRDTVIEDHRGQTYRAIHLDDQQRIKYAIFLNDTTFAHSIERAFRRGMSVSSELGRPKSVDAVLAELQPAKASGEHEMSGWTCRMCGYVHEGANPPELCPVCGVGKDQFMAA